MSEEEKNILLLDEEDSPILTEKECEEFKPVLKDFISNYAENRDKPVEEWLSVKMQEQLPERKLEEVQNMAKEIIETLQVNERNQESLSQAVSNGRSKESWFASSVQKTTSAMSAQEASKYLQNLDMALEQSNDALYRTITTKAGTINQNPSLDGFIAEQYHAQTFNLNAEANGSEYRARVLEPGKGGYAKNSVDIVIEDGNGKIVRRYQSKYCKDAAATERAFANGDYRGQQKCVPAGQENEISKKCTSVIESPDGVKSKPLSKEGAKELQEDAQSGNWKELDWNEYAVKDLAVGIGKNAGRAAVQGAAIGVGMNVAQKLWNGEEIEAEEVVETAITSGADFGVKAAAAGALKVGIEKDIIKVIPKGTPAGTIANIAHIAVENVKVVGKVVSGELSLKEGIEKMEQTTVATAAGLVTMAEGAAAGAAIGAVFGPVGAAVGGFVGGSVGYMAGSKVGETLVKGAQKVRDCAVEAVHSIASGIGNAVSSIASGIGSFVGGLFGW